MLEHKQKFVFEMQHSASTQIMVLMGTSHTVQLPAHLWSVNAQEFI
jgi:hypothetical protein